MKSPLIVSQFLIGLIFAGLCLTGCRTQETLDTTSAIEPATATLIVAKGDIPLEEVTRDSVTWNDKPLTAFEILEKAGHEVTSTGEGETRFVSAIDGLENLGSAGDNWTFRINGKLGDRSSDAVELKDGDEVLWKFGEYTPETP